LKAGALLGGGRKAGLAALRIMLAQAGYFFLNNHNTLLPQRLMSM